MIKKAKPGDPIEKTIKAATSGNGTSEIVPKDETVVRRRTLLHEPRLSEEPEETKGSD